MEPIKPCLIPNNTIINSIKSSDIQISEKYILSNNDYEKLNYNEKNNLPKITLLNTSQQITENINSGLNLVDPEIIKDAKIPTDIYNNKSIYVFENDKNSFLFLPKEKKIFEYNDKKNNNDKTFYKNNYKDILKSMVIIFAWETHLNKKIDEAIEDEYAFEEYFLVKKSFIDNIKIKNSYSKIYEKLKEIDFNYHKFMNNPEEIINSQEFKIFQTLIPKGDIYFTEKEMFSPKITQLNDIYIKDISEKISYPDEFEIIPKKLFNLLIKNNIDYEYVYDILIGDNLIFIQDKFCKSMFYLYTFSLNNELILSYILYYNNQNTFFNEIKKFIKGHGFANYLNKRKIKNNIPYKKNIIYKENSKYGIGFCITCRKFEEEEVKKIAIKAYRKKNYIIYENYIKFKKSINKIIDKKINFDGIDDIDYRYRNYELDFIPIFIVDEKDFEKNEEFLRFKDYESLKFGYKKNIFDQFIDDLIDKKFETAVLPKVNKLEIITSSNIVSNTNIIKKKFTFVNEQFLKDIHVPKEKYNNIKSIFFINNNEKLLYFIDDKKLYKMEFDITFKMKFNLSNYDFNVTKNKTLLMLKKFFNQIKDFDNIVNNNIYDIDESIFKCNNINSNTNNNINVSKNNINNYFSSEGFYIINKMWLKIFKLTYKYDRVSKCLLKNIKIKLDEIKPNINEIERLKNITNEENMKPQMKNIISFNFPINFELISQNLFVSIISRIYEDDKSKIPVIIESLKNLYIQQIFIYDHKIFIHKMKNERKYLIFEKNYELKYILETDNIKDVFNNIVKFKNYNSFFENAGIKINLLYEPQLIIDDKLNEIGKIYIIELKKEQKSQIFNCNRIKNENNDNGFIDSCMRCLCHIQKLKNYFENRQNVFKDINNNACLIKEFFWVINSLWKEDIEKLSTEKLKEIIYRLESNFKNINIRNSYQILCFIYYTLHNELRNNLNKSIISDLFYFQEQIKINENNTKINNLNIFEFDLNIISKELSKKIICQNIEIMNISLEDCFDYYENNYNIISYPEILTISLINTSSKYDLLYPMYLDLKNHISNNIYTENNTYELICILNIFTNGNNGFFAYCKSLKNNKWYQYNNTSCIEINDITEINDKPYILIYQRISNNTYENINHQILLNIFYNNQKRYCMLVEKSCLVKFMLQKFKEKFKIKNEANDEGYPPFLTLHKGVGDNMQEVVGEYTVEDNELKNKMNVSVKVNVYWE